MCDFAALPPLDADESSSTRTAYGSSLPRSGGSASTRTAPRRPASDDVRRVRTTSEQTSVSIHLLANDTGCVWRHTYDERTGEQPPFRSRYVNADCAGGEGWASTTG